MRNVSSDDEPPAICRAIDVALESAFAADHRFTNRYLAGELGVSEAAVGRWRRATEPTREQLAALERALNKPLGYLSRRAGYVADDPTAGPATTEDAIANDDRINEQYRGILLAVLERAVTDSAAERAARTAWTRSKRARGR